MIEIKAMADNVITMRNKKGANLTLTLVLGSQGNSEYGYFVDFKVKKVPGASMGEKKKKKHFG